MYNDTQVLFIANVKNIISVWFSYSKIYSIKIKTIIWKFYKKMIIHLFCLHVSWNYDRDLNVSKFFRQLYIVILII